MKALDERREPLLRQLADVFQSDCAAGLGGDEAVGNYSADTRYRALAEQIPAVAFLADSEQGSGRVSFPPRIQAALGISEQECQYPVYWYRRIHPDDKDYQSAETAKMLSEGAPLRCRFRIMAQGDRIVWFQCEARMVRRRSGEPWFVHGANGYITKQRATDKVLTAIRRILAGDIYVSERVADRVLQRLAAGEKPDESPISKLSDRELEVFRFIAEGWGARQIAEDLHLSVKTVETYEAHLKEKLCLGSVRELMRFAVEWRVQHS